MTLDAPDMGIWSYGYGAVSNLKTQTDARGCVTSLGYDTLERMLSKSFSGSCSGNTMLMSYDHGVNGIGWRYSMHDGWAYNYQYACDAHGRLSGETRSLDNVGVFTTIWSYNSDDMVSTMRYPASEAGDYTYLNFVSHDIFVYIQTI